MKDKNQASVNHFLLEKQRLLVLKIYKEYVKIKLLEIMWVKEEDYK